MSNEPMMYGGQAVIKGVMMRSPKYFAVVCRRDSGALSTRVEPIVFPNRPSFFKWPLVRGSLALFDAMTLGVKALMWSASIAMEDADEAEKAQKSQKERKEIDKARKTASGAVGDIAIGGSLVFGLGMGIFLFIVLPNLVAGLLHPYYIQSKIGLNLVEGVLRVTFFLAYITIIGSLGYIREVFQYHGAEHRAINTFEAGQPLDLEHTKQFGVIHVRCGTNFILIVLVLSIFVFSLIPWTSVLQRVAMRLILLPLVAGVAYDIIRLAGRNSCKPSVGRLMAPGLALQRLTTRPPSDDQVEVALEALKLVVAAEKDGVPVKSPDAVPYPAGA